MKSKIIKQCLGISFIFFLSGCAAVGSALNPYEDDFKCSRKAPFGNCETTLEVYSSVIAGDKHAGTVASDPGAIPAGYEILASSDVEALPTYSVGGAASEPQYKMGKIVAPLVEPVTSVGHLDQGDGVVYPESFAEKKPKQVAATNPLPTFTVRPNPETAYRDASLAKAAKLLKEPVTPVVIPPSVMRILILPRKGEDGELNMAQFSFMMVDKPRWSMGDYLSAMPEED